MNSAYAVGASFTLENLFSPELNKIAGDLTKFDARVDKTKLTFVERVEKMAGSFDLLGPAADKAATAMLGAMDRAVGGVTKASASIRGEIDGRMFAGADLAANAAADEIIAAMGRAAVGASEDAVKIKDAFGSAFVDMDAGLEGSVSGITVQIGRITASAGEAATAIKAIRTELDRLAAIPAMSLPTLPGGAASPGGAARLGQRRGGHGGGPHFGRVGTEIPGGHASIGGGAGLAAAGMIGFGIYEASQERDEVNKLLITGQVDANSWGVKRDQITKLLQDTAGDTGYSVGQVGEALSKAERAMSGLDVDTKMKVTQALIPYAVAEAKLKDTSLAESLESMVGLAHMTGTYDPAEIADLARKFSFVSLSTNASLPSFEKTLSYSLPTLRAGMGMDSDTIMALTATAQNSGITSTKSGTWIRSFFEGSEPEVGDGEHAKKHNDALRKFGLLDDSNVPTWKVTGANGKTDWTASAAKESQLLAAHLANMPVDEKMGAVKNIWGERGGAFASMLQMGTFLDQFTTLAAKIQNFKGGEEAIESYAKDNPAQNARKAWREFENVLMDIGQTALPLVNSGFLNLDAALKAIPGDWEATKKMWSDRVDGVFHAPAEAAKKLGEIPGVGVPFRDTSKPAFDPNTAYEAGGFQPMSYRANGDSYGTSAYGGGESTGGVSDAEETIYRGTLRAFTDFAAGKSIAGGTGGGGGFMSASFEGGSFGFGGGGSGSGGGGAANLRYGPGGHSRGGSGGGGPLGLAALPHGAVSGTVLSRGDDAMKHLMSLGVSREAAAAIVGNAQQESSVSGHGPLGDTARFGFGDNAAHGMFQWRADRFRALKAFADARGKDWRDEHTELEFAVEEAKRRGNSGWLYGHDIYAANQGMKRFEQYGESRDGGNFRTRLGNANMWDKRAQGYNSSPTAKVRFAPPQPIHVHVDTALNVDGRKMASVVSYHQAKRTRYPTGIGMDPHGHFVNPTTPVMDSA